MNKQSTNLTHIYFLDKIKRPTLRVKETKGKKKEQGWKLKNYAHAHEKVEFYYKTSLYKKPTNDLLCN